MKTLLVHRRGVLFEDEHVGPVLELPAPPSAASLQPDAGGPPWREVGNSIDAVASALGLNRELTQFGKVEEIILHGLHDPTPWESQLLSWLSRQLGVDVPTAPPSADGPFTAFAQAARDPAQPWPAPPDGLSLQSADDTDLEALGGARWLRARLLERTAAGVSPAEAAHQMLVLVPDDLARLALWQARLEDAGLSVRARGWATLADTAMGRWAVALLRLAGCTTQPVRREVLAAVFGTPAWRMPAGGRRSDVRALLRSLRRPTITIGALRAHAAAWFQARQDALFSRDAADADTREKDQEDLRARAEAVDTLLGWVEDALGQRGPTVWAATRALLGQGRFATQRVLGAKQQRAHLAALSGVQDAIDDLAQLDTEGASAPAWQQLQNALGQRGSGWRERPSVGVRLQTWSAWDGKPATDIILAGLEEGGWPCAPAQRSADEAELATALGLGTPIDELRRQSAVFARALAAASDGGQALLSWSCRDSAGADTFPGAALAGRPMEIARPARSLSEPERAHHNAKAAAWKARCAHIAERDLLPATIEAANNPADLRLFPRPNGVEDAGWERAARAAAHTATVTEQRRDGPSKDVPGPWGGALGAPVPEQQWSATALEAMGQCPTKFFLSRLMRAAREEDAGTFLDAQETGTLMHAAFARAAMAKLEAGGVWDLQPSDGQDAAAFAAGRAAEVDDALREEVRALRAAHRTLGAGIAEVTRARWQQAAERSLVEEAKAPRGGRLLQIQESDLEDPDTLLRVDCAQVRAYRAALDGAQRARAFLEELGTSFKTKKALDDRARELGIAEHKPFLTLSALQGAYSNQCLDTAAIHKLIEAKLSPSKSMAAQGAAPALASDRAAVPRAVHAVEWAFGSAASSSDEPADPRSTPTPLSIPVDDGPPLLVNGRIDRVDAVPGAGPLAIVDYKTSANEKSGDAISKEFGAGLHLQLPLYGAAADQLLAPTLGRPGDRVESGRLQYVRLAKQSTLDLHRARFVSQPVRVAEAAEEAPEVGADEVLRKHLSATAKRLRSGVLPLAPTACPLRKDKGAHCDFERTCGFVEGSTRAPASPAPRYVTPTKPPEDKGPKKAPPWSPGVPLSPPRETPGVQAAQAVEQQTKAHVRDLGVDVVVSAGAGSGKTTALVDRYVEAVEHGVPPDQILAITFTRRATAEMRHRVRERLLSVSERVNLDDATRRDAVLAIGAAPVLTIDAFAARVVAGLDPGNAAEVSADTRGFIEGWLDSRLVDACEHPDDDLTLLLRDLPLSEVRNQLLALLQLAPERLSALAALSPAALQQRWIAGLDRAWPELQGLRVTLAGMLAPLPGDGTGGQSAARDFCAVALAAAEQAGSLGLLAALAASTSIKRSTKKEENMTGEDRLMNEVAAVKARWVGDSVPTSGLANILKAAVADAKHHKTDPLTTDLILAAVNGALTAESNRTLAALRTASHWQAGLDAARKERGVQGFDDVLRQATELLRAAGGDDAPVKASDVRAQFNFQHVFIDELQDTNAAQVELFDALCAALAKTGAAPKRFYVGDLKQSIYRFRGAEVDVFAQQQALPGRTQAALNACWRARPRLTRAVNQLFGRVLAPESGGASTDPLAAVDWQPLACRWDSASNQEEQDTGVPPVELIRAPAEAAGGDPHAADDVEDDRPAADTSGGGSGEGDESGGDEAPSGAEVAGIVARIAALQSEHPDWKIAVLTHSWRLATLWGEHLRAAQIPAYVQGGRGLLSDPAVAPLVGLLDALEREDDLGILEVLRGPLVGLSDTTLWAVRNAAGVSLPDFDTGSDKPVGRSRVRLSALRHGFSFDAVAAEAWLQAAAPGPLPAHHGEALRADATRITAWREWWSAARHAFGLDPLDRVLAEVISATGYRHTLAQGDDRAAARVRLAALRKFEHAVRELASQSTTAGDVVRELRRRDQNEEDASAASNPYSGNAVTVTVVHQAKGLAWDVVVLPALHKATVRSRVDGLAPVRIAPRGEAPIDLPYVRRTKRGDPLGVEGGLAAALVALATAPWERAEQRRLFYVACTRAKQRLVLGGLPAGRADLEGLYATLTKRAGGGAPSHRQAKCWSEDLVLALAVTPAVTAAADADAAAAPEAAEAADTGWAAGDDCPWVAGADYTWVEPPPPAPANAGKKPTETKKPAETTETKVAKVAAIARALRAVSAVPVTVLHPSRTTGKPASPAGEAAPLEGAPVEDTTGTAAATPLGKHPFASARLAGTIAHRVFATWGWHGEPDLGRVEAAIHDHLPAGAPRPGGAAEWLLQLVRHTEAGQPALAAELRAAAARGDVIHEARVQVALPTPEGVTRVEGTADLLWRDTAGRWHLLDYKATEADDLSEATLDAKVRHYHPQVALYDRALDGRLPKGASLATYGLWFVREGRVVRWRRDPTPSQQSQPDES